MTFHSTLVICATVLSCNADSSFPADFKFGAATSSYQIEGGWNADGFSMKKNVLRKPAYFSESSWDGCVTYQFELEQCGKGESSWDSFVHEHTEDIKDGQTGDVAADSYNQWREDIRIAAEMGLQFYRFSINWPRILPTGFNNKINKAGVRYYSDLIDALLVRGIEPVVTLYHWEMPVKIRDLGGWTNPLIVEWFGDYARVIFSLYADRVKTWININEAISICDYAFTKGHFAPKIKEPEFAPYICNKNILLAHATAYRIYEKEFKSQFSGRISLANYELCIRPATINDTTLADLGRQHSTGRYSHPIFSKEGGWPPSVEKLMLEYSLKQGYKKSRLPSFTEEEVEFIKGTADFYGMNHYTTNTIRPTRPGEDPGFWVVTGSPELNATLESPPNSKFGLSPILPIVPDGIREQLSWIKQEYGDIDILITENGYSTTGSQINDVDRVEYFKAYLEQVLLSIKVDNVSVIGYTAWSLIDNFEWLDGYTTKFGIYQVDYKNPNRTRTPRTSAHYLACVIKNRSLDISDTCYKYKYLADVLNGENGGHVFMNVGLLLIISLLINFNVY